MARRKQSGLDVIASMPWPVGIAFGVMAYWIIRHGIGIYFASQESVLGQAFSGTAFAPIAWVALAACWLVAGASALQRRKRNICWKRRRVWMACVASRGVSSKCWSANLSDVGDTPSKKPA